MVTKNKKPLVFKALRIDPDIWQQAGICAKVKGITLQDYITQALESANKKT